MKNISHLKKVQARIWELWLQPPSSDPRPHIFVPIFHSHSIKLTKLAKWPMEDKQ